MELIQNKEVVNQMFVNGKNISFIPFKDHKTKFLSNRKVPLQNTAKTHT